MTNPNFGGTPFAAGSLFGFRAFTARPDGYLVGPHFGTTFLPGENEAQCLEPTSAWWASIRGDDLETKRIVTLPDHVGSLSCSCGFYAYYTGTNDYMHGTHRVAAIIEGFGRCTYGDRGFRCSKAKLVALVKPDLDQEDKYEEFVIINANGDTITRFYPVPRFQSEATWKAVTEVYRDVPVYNSISEATEAHPISTFGQEEETSDVQ